MTRIFIYSRISKQEKGKTNIENQHFKIQDIIKETIEPHRILSDVCSGTVPPLKRPEFKALLAKVEPKDEVHVLRVDRLSRDLFDLLKIVEVLESRKITLIVHDLPHKNLLDPTGKLMLHLLGMFAQFERDKISERSKIGVARARANGKQIGRRYGSTHAQEVEMLVKAGFNNSQIARQLNITTKTVYNIKKSNFKTA